jgi:NAD-dependent dihydropyrimidine dehydrogenase PreA subunit
VNPDGCTGCRKCVKACTAGAIIPIAGKHSMSLI